jgi:hypothetical protein
MGAFTIYRPLLDMQGIYEEGDGDLVPMCREK